MEQSAGITVLRDSARVILSSVLIVVGFGVAGAVAGQVLAWILVGLLGAWLLVVHRRVLRNTPGEIEARNGVAEDIQTMMSYGVPLYVGSLLTTLVAQYQNIILAIFTSNVEIGNFNAAVNFGALVGIVATPVATSLFPAFSKLDLQTRKDELKRMFELSVKYATLLILPLAVGLGALSKDLIRAVYGVAYGYASTGLGYYVVGNFLNGVGRTKDTVKIGVVQLAIFLPAAPVMALLYRVPGLILALMRLSCQPLSQ